MKTQAVVSAIVFVLSVAVFGEEQEPAAPAATTTTVEFYNFSELISKAERIVLGEIGEKKDGVVMIRAIETLKSPKRDAAQISPDAYKRAQELLSGGKSEIPPQLAAAAIENINVGVIPLNEKMLPPQGVQVVFFLWGAEKREEGKLPVYRINNPQNIYDSKELSQIRAGLAMPRTISDGRFLRDWDKRAAARAALRKVDEELKKNAGGAAVLGLQIETIRPKLLLRGDNSFQVATHLINGFSKETMVYDGPASAYGIIIRAKDAAPESALVLRLNTYDEVDPMSLDITSLTDFEGISGNNLLKREHLFDAKKFPALKTLAGDYVLKMFYTNNKNGSKDGLNSPAWTGTVVSKEVPVVFKRVEVKATQAEK